jgi:UDP-N-acetylglucosamine 2-epimerase (non-hydrolysing)
LKAVSIVIGTRPEAIKMAPVVLALRKQAQMRCHVCVTAQHRQMLDQVLEAFNIVPDVDLNLMQANQSLGALTAALMESLDRYLAKEKPDLVLAQGDTTTLLCAALSAFYHHIPFGHVEAGLRTGNLQSPWPEEANRVMASRLTTLHFAPTETSRKNLLAENVPGERIHVTGNTGIDALHLALAKVKTEPPAIPGLPSGILANSNRAPIVLITGHRRENFGGGFDAICGAIAQLAGQFEKHQFVYPVHLNPKVRESVMRILGPVSLALGNIHLLEPLPYLPFVALMNHSTLILTDSGGIQEEAPSLGKPVLVMRDTTERPEAVEAGTVKLVGADRKRIAAEVKRLLTDREAYEAMAKARNPFGDGHAAERIVEACGKFLSGE